MTGVIAIAYLLAGVLFIRSLGGLSKQETAARGNLSGMLGMALAVGWPASRGSSRAISARSARASGCWWAPWWSAAAIGAVLARRVEMTGMPELVAILHSFVGLAAVLVGISSYLAPRGAHDAAGGGASRGRTMRGDLGRRRRRRAHLHRLDRRVGQAARDALRQAAAAARAPRCSTRDRRWRSSGSRCPSSSAERPERG